MAIEISTVKQDAVGKLSITGDSTVTRYLYPPFSVLFSASEEAGTKFVLRCDSTDHVIFVNDQQSIEILSGFPRFHDDAAAKVALDRHDAQLNRAEERKNAPPAPPTATAAATAPMARPAAAPIQSTPTYCAAANRPRSGASARAHGAAKAVETLAWIGAILGLIAGIVVASRTEGDSYYDNVSHPYVGIGILIAVLSVVQALPTIMIAAYIQSRTE